MRLLPEKMLRCVSAEDRKKLGKAGMTAQEALAKGEAKTERELQRQIISLLRLKGIEVNVSRMDKRKTDKVGWPDLTFAVWQTAESANWVVDRRTPCAWEIKLPGCKPTPIQADMNAKMWRPPNAWKVRVIHSVDEAIAELRDMGIS